MLERIDPAPGALPLPPVVLYPIVAQWGCRSRTHCCRAWRIDVPPAGLRRMAQQCSDHGDTQAMLRLLGEHPEQVRLCGSCALPLNADGSCMFLEQDTGLCAYRRKYGDDTLPDSCLKFPLLGMLTPERRLLGLSFACPTALDLLARQGPDDGQVVENYQGPPPTTILCDFLGDAGAQSGAAAAFWQGHWRLVERFHGLDGSPRERLQALAALIWGELPAVAVDRRLWEGYDSELAAPLLRQGAEARVLQAVYDGSTARLEPDGIAPDPPAGELLSRYLDQRLLVPEFLITGASLTRALGMLFAAAARFRHDRARGSRVMHAVLHLDRLLLHSDWIPLLFPDGVDEEAACRSLALLALAE